METPTNSQQVNVHDMMDVYIAGNTEAAPVKSLISSTALAAGSPVPASQRRTANYLWLNPTFSVRAALDITGTNIAITLPTESWHTYQLQYKNALTDPSWSNLGQSFWRNDTLETVTTPTSLGNRFYHATAY